MKRGITLLLLMLPLAASADPMRPLPGSAAASAAAGAATALRGAAQAALAAPAAPTQKPLPPLVAIRTEADGSRRALLGDTWVSAGARVAGAQITAIGASSIELQQAGRSSTLHLLPPLVASTSTGADTPSAGASRARTALPAQRPTRAPAPRQP